MYAIIAGFAILVATSAITAPPVSVTVAANSPPCYAHKCPVAISTLPLPMVCHDMDTDPSSYDSSDCPQASQVQSDQPCDEDAQPDLAGHGQPGQPGGGDGQPGQLGHGEPGQPARSCSDSDQ